MKALVLGAGIVGITTAYELNRDGHEVTVIDREPEPANFTSFSNAGLFAPGHAYAWSSPAAPKILLRSLWRGDQALRFKFSTDPRFWKWMWRFWGECTAERAALNTTRKVKLCNYSLDVFHDTVTRTGVDYDGRTGGLIYLYRSEAALKAASAKSCILSDNGCRIETLDRDGVAARDPALAPVKDKFAGALYAPDDESGDCRKFSQNMAAWLKGQGVTFKYNTTITGFEKQGDRISAVMTDRGQETADVIVLCLGVYSPHLARELGHDLAVYPVKGYAITAPMAGRNNPPTIGGVDEETLVAYAPLGDRVRVTATAEFSGYGRSHRPQDFETMLATMKTLFPDGADWSKASFWAGLRPMTPEGTPILGPSRMKNLWFNTGQGHMGWTMSHGAARITADLVAGKRPAIALDGMLAVT
ncbi:amino acid dehydrogenase [Aestuariivirga litoralis]|uniref:Amino acid dehydrogenase n=1 Tax=Aestuariivirga litoralis TaxID=2650924 RepID=A0A2W2AK89_9HYPH|nr:D-amino acid dehydrogenase [Aestuariivirga litoralis]PZF75741.1 amino acid dehydrogenase [Aestuariivirga litoralis]